MLGRALFFAAACLLVALEARAEAIIGARYEAPVERYGHFALGRPQLAGALLVLQLQADLAAIAHNIQKIE